MARVRQVLLGRGWKMGALLVAGGTAAGLIAWGVAPWVATLAGVTPVLLALACAIPCLLPFALLRRAATCGATDKPTSAAICRCDSGRRVRRPRTGEILGGTKPDSRPRPNPAVSPAGAFPG
jgi:hypothetical protein